jgi:hypothetical protein
VRKQKTIVIDRARFTVKELRVKDIRALLGEKDSEKNRGWMLSLSTGLDAKRLYGLPRGDLDRLWRAVREVNAAFFDKPRPAAGSDRSRTSSTNGTAGHGESEKLTSETLDRSICRLIERGHAQAWNYGWAFFMTALTVSEGLEKDRLRNMAIAARMGNAEMKAWKKFLSGQ